jgi:hypothetical protein
MGFVYEEGMRKYTDNGNEYAKRRKRSILHFYIYYHFEYEEAERIEREVIEYTSKITTSILFNLME